MQFYLKTIFGIIYRTTKNIQRNVGIDIKTKTTMMVRKQ